MPRREPLADCDLAESGIGPRPAELVCLDGDEEPLSVRSSFEGSGPLRTRGVSISDLPPARALLSNVRHVELLQQRILACDTSWQRQESLPEVQEIVIRDPVIRVLSPGAGELEGCSQGS